jgi:dihydropteridine reductase
MSGRVLIYGGRGGLGSVLVSHFKQKGWWVCSVDILEPNEVADVNVIVDPNTDWLNQEQQVTSLVEKHMGSEEKLDSIINMAGKCCKLIYHLSYTSLLLQ